MELGIGMFGDLAYNKATGKYQDAGAKLREIVEQVKLMDEVGLDVFGIGEHHRPDYAVSSPDILLAAAASVTKNIKLMSTVSVLSSSDAVKVYQNFSTIDQLSCGRAEIGVGRGSFIESFPLFGYDLKDYEKLFEEKLDLLLNINNQEIVNWEGKFRRPMVNQGVYPRAFENKPLPVWVAVGGTPESVLRAAKLGLPLIVAIIGGQPAQFKPLIEFYKEQYVHFGHDVSKMQVGIHSHALLSDQPAIIDQYYYDYAAQMDRIGKDRGWMPYQRFQFDGGRAKDGALFIGDAAEVTDKILHMHELFGLDRFIAHMDVGAPGHDTMMKSIEIFGTKVAPEVRKALNKHK